MEPLERVVRGFGLLDDDHAYHMRALTIAFDTEGDHYPHAAYMIVDDLARSEDPAARIEATTRYLEQSDDDPITTGSTTRTLLAIADQVEIPMRTYAVLARRHDLHASGSSALGAPGLPDDLTALAIENGHSTLGAHPGNPQAWDARSVHLGAHERSDAITLMRPIFLTAGVCSYAETSWRYALDDPDSRVVAIDLPGVPAAAAIKVKIAHTHESAHNLVALADIEGPDGWLAAGGLYTADARTLRAALDANGDRRIAVERLGAHPARFLDELSGAGAVRRVRERLFTLRERAANRTDA